MEELRIKRLKESIELSQKWLQEDWLDRQCRKNRISFENVIFYKEIIEVLEHTYPGDWSFECEINFNTSPFKILLHPLIRFRRFTISNRNNLAHQIRNFFVKLHYNWTGQIRDILGCRMHFCYKSFIKGYSHSHLRPRPTDDLQNNIEWQSFCLGSGEISMTFAELRDVFDKNKFQMLLFQLPILLEWESLDGVPYVKIDSIDNPIDNRARLHNHTASLSDVAILINVLRGYWKTVSIIKPVPQFTFAVNSKNNIEIRMDDSFEMWFLPYGKPQVIDEVRNLYEPLARAYIRIARADISESDMESYINIVLSKFFCANYKDVDYEYRSTIEQLGQQTIPNVNEEKANFNFIGEKIIRVIELPPKIEELQEIKFNYTIANKVLNDAKKKFEKNINYNRIRDSAIKSIS